MTLQFTPRRQTQTVAEILKSIKDAKSKKDRLKILKDNEKNAGLISVIRLQFDDRFVFALPEGVPDGFKNDVAAGEGIETLKHASKKFYYFIKGASNMRQVKREALFLGLIQTLDKEEAAILIAVKDKKLDFGLTRKLIDEAFPGLIPATKRDSQDAKEGPQKTEDNKST